MLKKDIRKKDIVEELMEKHKDSCSEPPTTFIMSTREEYVLVDYIKLLENMSNREVIREVDLRSDDGTDQDDWFIFKIRLKEATEMELDKRMRAVTNPWIQELMTMMDEDLIQEFHDAVEDLPGSGARGRHRYETVADEIMRRMKRSKSGTVRHADDTKIY